ncbi:VOC family protein [uncultured Massilia sp.]|uniref:VOC family protein n=1 Tax=uncultured Massilia sp. TaxID=169973 RepID=UPI0025E6FF8C|nr:VOC family protein [uncultured Massilia sp.]
MRTFHHLGIACKSIEREEAVYASLGYVREGERFVDPLQGVRGSFMTGDGPRIELLENLPDSTTLAPWLAKGVRVYHMAYLADDFDAEVEVALRAGWKMMRAPLPAIAFGGARVCFLMMPNMQLIELVERKHG